VSSAIGVQVVYTGGIEPTLDGALYAAAGRDVNDEGCTIHGEQRRDMFWRCDSEDESTDLACRLLAVEHNVQFTVMIKSEDQHFKEKMLAVESSAPQVFGRSNRNPRRHRMSRQFSHERIWREFFCACIPTIPYSMPDAANLADEAYKEYRTRFSVREPELDDESAETESDSEASTAQTKKEPVQ
jgi:hypothetical protein